MGKSKKDKKIRPLKIKLIKWWLKVKKTCSKKNTNTCQYKDITQCPYNRQEECPNLKKHCHLPESSKHSSNSQVSRSNFFAYVLAAFGIVGIVVGQINPECIKTYNPLIVSISTSLLAGALVALLVDLPQKAEKIMKLMSTALVSFEYLGSLSREQLKTLRSRVTNELYSQKAPNMPRGILLLDQRLCDLLEEPYYSTYRETIHCQAEKELISNSNPGSKHKFIEKEVTEEYTIINPFSHNHIAKANIGISKYLIIPKDFSVTELFQIESYQVSIDGSKYIDILPLIDIHSHTYEPHNSGGRPDAATYNAALYLKLFSGSVVNSDSMLNLPQRTSDYKIDPTITDDTGLKASFKKQVSVIIKYKQHLDIEDNHYTRRLRYPAQSYRLDYNCSQGTRLLGQLFGTLVDQSKVSINISKEKNMLSIESHDWLLPKSGAFVVMSK